MTTRDGKVALVNPNGELVQVDPSEAEARVSSGLYARATDDQVAAYDSKAQRQADLVKASELQSAGAIAETALKSGLNAVGRPVAWGIQQLTGYNVEDIGMSPEEAAAYHQRERDLAAANPLAAEAGTIAGTTFGLGKLGVLGAAGRARAALGGFRGALAGGAIEGGGFGAAQAMAEDPKASAEHVLASGAIGALLGAGTGALLHAGGRGLSRVFASPESSALTKEAAAMAEGSVARDAAMATEGAAGAEQKGALSKMWNALTEQVSGAPKELLEDVGPTGARRSAAIEAAHGFDRWADSTALKMASLSNEAVAARDAVLEHARNRVLRADEVRALTNEAWNTVERRRFVAAGFKLSGDALQDSVAKLQNGAEGNLPVWDLLPGSIKTQMGSLQRHAEQGLASLEGQDAAYGNVALAQFKTNLQKTVIGMRKAANESQKLNPFERDAVRQAAAEVEKLQEEVRQALIDPKVWGETVAKAHSDVNLAWHEGGVDSLKAFGKLFQRDTGKTHYDTGETIYETDPAKLLSALKTIGTANGAVAERTFEDYLKNTDRLINTIGERFKLDDATQKAVKVARERFTEMKGMFDQARTRGELASKFKELENYRASGALGLVPILNTVAGNPASAARFAQSTEGAARKWLQTDILDSVSHWVRSAGESTVGKASKTQAPRGLATSAAVALFRGKHQDVTDAYPERVQALLQADPATLGKHVSDLAGEAMIEAGAGASNAIAYLRESLPPYLQSTTLLRSTQKMPFSQPDLTKFARIWGTVADPSTAIQDLKAGRFTPSQAKALQRVYPGIYNELRNTTIEALGRSDAEGKTIPIQVREQLSLLLDLDGGGEPVLSYGFASKVQGLAAAQMKETQSQQRPPAPRVSKSSVAARTPLEQALEI